MKLSFDLRNRWRATTALCVVSTLAIVTASYGAEWGRSNWDKRKHSHQRLPVTAPSAPTVTP